jgi:very-short-patch-repair endonuclease
MLQRLFTVLAYKTKIMTANWIVAERLIIPIRIAKIGEKERPATDSDIRDVQNQLAAVANEPNMTLVTHHAFELDWIGATGKIHNITSEIEQVGKEILDGLMLNQAILNGEMCIPEEDLTLTKEGFKSLDQITEDDYIGTFNVDTHCIEYQKYEKKHVYNYDGDLYSFKANEIDFSCTPNHKMLFKQNNEWQKEIASEINGDIEFIKINNFCKGNVDSFSIDKNDIIFNCKENKKTIYYKGRVYCFTVPNHNIITMRNGKIMVSGNSGYSSAQVGVEVLIRRLENWRNKLKAWVEKHLFLPVAKMQGFIDEEKTKEYGEIVFLYPKLIWNDLQLRDKTNKIQTLMQMYDKQMVSASTVLEELDLDYDTEVEKIREEQVMASSTGMVGGMGGGGNLGTMGMGGDMGMGAPGGDMGGDMGMGAPGMGGDMGMGAPGGDMGGGGAPGGGGMGMGAAASSLPVIGKRGQKGKEEKQEPGPPPKMIKLTNLEQKMFKTLSDLNVPYALFAQYQIKVPGESRPYALDFAYPQIGIGCEVDGNVWHEREDFKQRDLNRDQKLSNVGWTVLRFNEDAVTENMDAVRDVISKYISEASKQKKKSEEEGKIIKTASNKEETNERYEYCLSNGKIGCNTISTPHAKILHIGNIENE